MVLRGMLLILMMVVCAGLPPPAVGAQLSAQCIIQLLLMGGPLPPVVGIYDLLPSGSLPPTPELANAAVAGLSLRCQWRNIEYQPDLYDWSLIDQALDRARQYGKKVMVRVSAGMWTPDWVYNSGAAFITVGTDKMPLVWDPIYLDRWCNFVDALGQRYRDNPDVVSVQMTGVGKFGEMGIALEGVNWDQYGYTDDKYINAWKTVIDAYQQAFPGKPTHLNMHIPFISKDDTMMSVVNYCLISYPRKVLIQANDLKEAGSAYSAYLRQAAAQTQVGYQMYGGREWDNVAMGDRQKAFQLGLADGIVYAEVYRGDLQDETLAGAVSYLAQGLAARAQSGP